MAEEYAASGDLDDDDDDEVFELARRKTIAVYQSTVEGKYSPTLLGDKLDTYQSYNPETDPSIDELFAVVSFRYGHSSSPGRVRMVDKDFHPTPSDPLLLRDVFKRDVQRIVRENGQLFTRGSSQGELGCQ
jgi:Animal haem peroxidase